MTMGGAERLFAGLLRELNEHTTHDAELIKVPSREHSLPDLVASYEAFSRLDLSHFDLVISTKYPSWMVRHPNHVVYMLHKLRGLYDTYWMTGRPLSGDYASPDLRALQELMRSNPGPQALDEFFWRFNGLLQERGPQDPAFLFPGPLAREIVHFLDGIALAPSAIRRYAAISRTVARRPGYFPDGVPVAVAYPPSDLRGLRPGRFDYFFTVSRLDAPKRMDLLIRAMELVPGGQSLKIAGTGPELERLRSLAARDDRVEFLGYVSSAELADLYADALAVPFVPLDEDFGLVTLEAMTCGKPVVTCDDSGGPNELVVDGISGYVTRATPEALAEALHRLATQPQLARRLGESGRHRAAPVTWTRALSGVLGRRSQPAPPRVSDRPKVVVLSTFPVHPGLGGGQLRCLHLYGRLAPELAVEIVSLVDPGQPELRHELGHGFWETTIPKSAEHEASESAISQSLSGLAVTDVVAGPLIHLTPAYLAAVARATRDASAVILAHPFQYRAAKTVRPDIPLVYDAHNAEFLLKAEVLGSAPAARALLELVREAEGGATRDAKLVSVCSPEDAASLSTAYGVPESSFLLIPNGVDAAGVDFVDHVERQRRGRRWRERFAASGTGRPPRATALFMGSWHPPNNDAAEQLLRFSTELPDVLFLLVGSHCHSLRDRKCPPNVLLMGTVSTATKRALLKTVDVALNPMRFGSGTNLKILEYLAAGIPVVSTPLGARGLDLVAGAHFSVAPVEEFPAVIARLLGEPAEAHAMARDARQVMIERYDWRVLARRFRAGLTSGLGLPVQPANDAPTTRPPHSPSTERMSPRNGASPKTATRPSTVATR